jgi:hypothetical protein
MGPPYAPSHVLMVNPSTRLTFQNCGKTYPTYADLCTYSDYLVSDMMNLLITLERFVGLDVHYDSEEDAVDTKYKFDLQDWIQKPLACWPRDDAEAKLIATAIASYDFNNYEVPKRYLEDAGERGVEDPCFVVQDPMFMAGMVWKGTCPSFYKLSIGSDLVKAVQAGKYPHVPTRVTRPYCLRNQREAWMNWE